MVLAGIVETSPYDEVAQAYDEMVESYVSGEKVLEDCVLDYNPDYKDDFGYFSLYYKATSKPYENHITVSSPMGLFMNSYSDATPEECYFIIRVDYHVNHTTNTVNYEFDYRFVHYYDDDRTMLIHKSEIIRPNQIVALDSSIVSMMEDVESQLDMIQYVPTVNEAYAGWYCPPYDLAYRDEYKGQIDYKGLTSLYGETILV